MMIEGVLEQFILTQDAVTGGLATYEFTTGQAETPAVFTGRVIPDDAEYPAIHIESTSPDDFSCRDATGAEIEVDVTLYANKEMSQATIRALAWTLYQALNRADIDSFLQDEGYESWGCIALPPVPTNDDDSFPAFLVRTTVRVLQNGE